MRGDHPVEKTERRTDARGNGNARGKTLGRGHPPLDRLIERGGQGQHEERELECHEGDSCENASVLVPGDQICGHLQDHDAGDDQNPKKRPRADGGLLEPGAPERNGSARYGVQWRCAVQQAFARYRHLSRDSTT